MKTLSTPLTRSAVRPTVRPTARPTALLAAGLLAASLALTGCSGGGGTEAYCDSLADAQGDIEGLEAGDPGAFETAFDAFDTLAEEAPEEVADEWETMQQGVQRIEDAFADAGLELDDFGDIMGGSVPEDVDQEAIAQLGESLQELDGEEFTQASEVIEDHAQAECDITLGE